MKTIQITGNLLGKEVVFNTEYYDKTLKSYTNTSVNGSISGILLDVTHGCYGVRVKCDNLPYTTLNNEVVFLDKSNQGSTGGRGEDFNQLTFLSLTS